MSASTVPKLVKWPFLLGDLLLVGVAAVIAFQSRPPLDVWAALVCFSAVALGAWLCTIPFLRDHEVAVKLAEADSLATVVSQVGQLEGIQGAISAATGRWKTVQELAEQTLAGAREISDRMETQTQEFQKFSQRAGEMERNTLRLEVEKVRRGEAECVQVLMRILDCVHALHQAGVRSGKPELISELTQFQNACRDTARRIGLLPLVPASGEPFDARVHLTPEPPARQPAPGTPITAVLATGFTYQAQLARRALVQVTASTSPNPELAPESAAEPEPDRPEDAATAPGTRSPTATPESGSTAPGSPEAPAEHAGLPAADSAASRGAQEGMLF